MTGANRERATLGGGCFWCLEAAYEQIQGVEEVVSGYTGGHVATPTYRAVCSGTTGHAEVVRITFDPDVVSFRTLLEIFFTIHDPTTLNRQGADVGTQYRSVIFYQDEAQREVAQDVIRAVDDAGVWDAPIVTQVAPAPEFYRAEEYHQHYYRRNPDQAYCQVVIAPKVAKLRKVHFENLRAAEADRANRPEGRGKLPVGEVRDPLDPGGIGE